MAWASYKNNKILHFIYGSGLPGRFLSMKAIYALILFVAASINSLTIAQSYQDLKSDISFYGDIVMNAAKTEHRVRASQELSVLVDKFLDQEKSFQNPLADIPWLSVISDTSNTFRFITWQLSIGDSIFQYEGRIQLASGKTITLKDKQQQIELLYAEGSPENWYGARYYKMKQFVYDNQPAYVLLGFNAHQKWNRRRVAEVLWFDGEEPRFGLPVFAEEGTNAKRNGRNRVVLTYSRDARVILDYDEKLGMIVHDHLIPTGERFTGQGETAVTDGSFEGYKLNDEGIWIYRSRLFEETSDEPLDDGRVKPKSTKDLFGREQKKRG